ncbi:ABC-type nitrate/sulfonate/bicarbonate transport system permease component [Asanoa ferruginea]|uniref:ABC-type nitrate/sulfonate/bicarbonate transport system permease component n=1 Tax=Asanoa ferruginea TaxID=53367 RepID=A0A3D9ZL77_9ACTN|nr:ABC transporter permease [Asanoa ferruginea]REF97344.1 ABC-type nitrate/sulfonate/bicarbonate transport system permease component [Asanoa ferruginea]GIF51190.1 nitrate ABC transporter permease [Asanoa ferruginea]
MVSVAARRPRVTGRRYRSVTLGALGLIGFGLVLEVAPRIGVVPIDFAPPTSQILVTLVGQLDDGSFWTALLHTLGTWAGGLAIAVVAGAVIGVLLGSLPILRAATTTTIEFLRPIPSVALIPLVIVLYGPTVRSTLILVVYAAFWQMLIQVVHGVADVDPVALDTARSFRLSPWARVRHVVWPSALPYVMTGLRLAAAVALILTITGELVIGSPGLGKEIDTAQQSNEVRLVYALIVVTGLLGVLINLVVRWGERRLLSWHPANRAEKGAA